MYCAERAKDEARREMSVLPYKGVRSVRISNFLAQIILEIMEPGGYDGVNSSCAAWPISGLAAKQNIAISTARKMCAV
jgi:hypothetical protein